MSRAWRRTAPPSDPDCNEIATLPIGSVTSTSEACSRSPSRSARRPMLEGPMIRSPLRRRDLATSASTSTDCPPVAVRSTSVTMTAPRIRLAMQASIVASRAAGGTATMASDTSSGRSAIDPKLRCAPISPSVVRVHRVGRNGPSCAHVAPERGTDRVRPVRCSDDCDRLGDQKTRDCARIGALFAAFDTVEELLGGGEIPVEVDHTRVETALEGPSGFRKHRQHASVVAEHFGGEPFDAVGAGDRGEVLEQGGDATAVMSRRRP